ncbi:MAG: HNH endonuclease [Pelagibacterales bacterium]|nr:HNH endonuclease [Pelagibacterales bacterium]
MNKLQNIGLNYNVIDAIEKMTVADSFVFRSNKIGGGNGEAKFYIGNDNEMIRSFFGSNGFQIKCFLLKQDLVQYLLDTEPEYKTPAQPYNNIDALPSLWNERLDKINKLNDILYFDINEQTQIAGPRLYVKSTDTAYRLIRELSLPNITYISAIKLVDGNGEFVFYFRLFVDYFGEVEHPQKVEEEIQKIEEDEIEEKKKNLLKKARIGQGKYRNDLLQDCPFCPITLVTDDRILIASHIKPWAVSNNKEKLDPKNGFMLTPTFDYLFDRGFISFSNDKKMIVSPWISNMTYSKLNITPNKKYLHLPIDGREYYLDYHRQNIFKT